MLVRRSLVLNWSLIVVVTLLPFSWIVFMEVNQLALKPIHIIAFALMATIPVLVPGKANWSVVFSGRPGVFIVLLFLFLLVNFAAMAWAVEPRQGLPIVVKNGIYFSLFLVLTLAISEVVREDRLIRVAVPGLLIGTIGYLIYNYILFAGLGYDYFSSIFSAVYTGNFRRLRYWFPHRLFNCHLNGACSSFSRNDQALTTPLINTITSSFVVYIVLVGMFFRHVRGRMARSLMIVAVVLCCFFVLISLSRSNLLALGLVLWFGGILGKVKNAESVVFRQLIYLVVAVVLLVGTGVFMEDALQDTMELLVGRVGGVASDTRIEMFINAINEIAKSPIIGYGTGAEVRDGFGRYHTVHNLFLASWYEQGFLGLALSLSWYMLLLSAVIKTYFSHVTFPGNISPRWVALLPTITLVRTQFSGGGELTIVDWVALSIFFGLIAGQRLSRRPGEVPNKSVPPLSARAMA